MDLFFECLEHRADFICRYTGEELEQMSSKMLQMLSVTDEMLAREIELIAVLYKWAPQEFQSLFFDRIMALSQERPLTPSFVVAVCNFLWINNKVFFSEQKKKSCSLLDELVSKVPVELSDTIYHTLHSFGVEFEKWQKPSHRVCLLIPEFLSGLSFLQPPIDFMIVSSKLKSCGIQADIFDNRAWHYSEQQLLAHLLQYDTIVVNTTPIDQVQNYFVDYRYALTIKYIKQIKEHFPNKKLIVCGSHGTVRCDLIEKHNSADIILCGEYVVSCVKVVSALSNGEDIRQFPNIAIKENLVYKYTDIDKTSMHPPLNEYDYPDYDSVDLQAYYGNAHFRGVNVKKLHWSILMTSCGCPFQCIFCYKFFGSHIRRHSVAHVMTEIRDMIAHKIESFFIIDQLFTGNRDFVIELCERIIEEKLNITWSCQTRIDQLDIELLQIMKKAGCSGIWIGLESVTDEVLSLNRKGTARQQIVDCIDLLNEIDISFNVFFMLGMPGETKESLNALYDFMEHYKLPCTKSFMVCTPRYGTEMYAMAEREHPSVADDFLQLNQWKGQISNSISQNDIETTIYRLSALLD